MSHSSELYSPTSVSWEDTQLFQFMNKHHFQQLQQLYQAVEDDPAWFWEEMVKSVGLTWFQPYTQVLDSSRGWAFSRWYVDGKMNIAYDAVDKYALGPLHRQAALVWVGDHGEEKTYTYADLFEEINRFASGLKDLGLSKGDRVAIYLPMIPEAVVALLGVAKMGAIAVPVFSGYGAEAIASRVNDCEAKVLVTVDVSFRRGKEIPMIHEALEALELCSSLKHLIIVERTDQQQTSFAHQKLITYQSLIKDQPGQFPPEVMDSEDPCLLLYTSGTTGKPKGTYHVHAGFPLKAAQDLQIAFHFQQGDTLFWVTDLGWMMGPWAIYGALLLGGTVLLLEGTPDYPSPDRLWKIVEDYQVSYLGISPTLIRLLMSRGKPFVPNSPFSSLKAFGSTGESWNPKPWLWLYQEIGKGQYPILNYSGGTEISGGIFGCFPGLPQRPCSFHGPIPGMVVDIVDKQGKSVTGKVGELVIKKPWPGMTRGFWNDQNNVRYQEAYWDQYSDQWVHGDWARVDSDGFWYIEGRSDDTLNIAGKRIGPAEYESALVAHPHVVEAATIGVPDQIKGTVAISFVVTNVPQIDKKSLEQELKKWMIQKMGKALQPKEIYCIRQLPKTQNGKIMRRVIRSIYIGEATGDLSSLENRDVIEEIRSLQNHSSN